QGLAMMRILIGDTCFPSKAAATDAIRRVLYRYPLGATVSDVDHAFLADVLARHPDAAIKIGVGVASFEVEANLGSRGFWLTRIDGTRTDWSFLSCLTPPTHAQDVVAALRTEVRDQVQRFKAMQFLGGAARCAVTGVTLTIDGAHVDHAIPFVDLVDAFLTAQQLTVDALDVQPTCDGNTDTRLSDRQVAQQWADYHRNHARLRLVSR